MVIEVRPGRSLPVEMVPIVAKAASRVNCTRHSRVPGETERDLSCLAFLDAPGESVAYGRRVVGARNPFDKPNLFCFTN